MSLDPPTLRSAPVGSADDLAEWLRRGEQPAARHRVGLEHEKIGVLAETGEAVPLAGERSLEAVLAGLAKETGGTLLSEGSRHIGLRGGAWSVSLEPGGQLELSGAPGRDVAGLREGLDAHLAALRRASDPLGIVWLSAGYRPFGRREAVPWLERGRYRLMRERLPGARARDMMQLTASVQASFDWADEQDLAEKASAATALSPLVAALTANSPLADGHPTGWRSERYRVWAEVDAARCGLPRFLFEPGFTYRKYVDWALQAPLLFVRRGGRYLDPGGRTFSDLLREGFLGEPATVSDWTDLLSTLFPEVRLKHVMELRGADAADAATSAALAALWTGVLYDLTARRDARALVRVSFEELTAFQEEAAREGLTARLGGASARELGRELLQVAADGLRRRFERGGIRDERPLLDPVREILETGRTPADRVLEVYRRTGGRRADLMAAWRY